MTWTEVNCNRRNPTKDQEIQSNTQTDELDCLVSLENISVQWRSKGCWRRKLYTTCVLHPNDLNIKNNLRNLGNIAYISKLACSFWIMFQLSSGLENKCVWALVRKSTFIHYSSPRSLCWNIQEAWSLFHFHCDRSLIRRKLRSVNISQLVSFKILCVWRRGGHVRYIRVLIVCIPHALHSRKNYGFKMSRTSQVSVRPL